MGNRPTDWHVLDLDDDPTPGDPERVKQLARELHDFADDVADALRQIKGMAGEDALLRWAGKTAKAFQDEFEEVPKNLKKLQRSYDLAGDALAAYWPKLERAQSLADKALAKGREAQSDLTAANGRLDSANSWVERATKKTEEYDGKEGKEKPDESEVRAATRNATDAKSARASAQTAVDNAQGGLEAAKKMAADAKKMREDAASEAKDKLEEASDAGIQNRKWWEKAVDWVKDNWDTIVTVCKVIVAVLGIVVLIIGGPLAWVVLAAALVVLADTLMKYMNGEASLWDVALAALDCIPGMKGLTTLGGLAKMAKGGMKAMAGLKAMKAGVLGLAKSGRTMLSGAAKGALSRLKNIVSKLTDPVDLATGQMYLSQTDVTLPGLLPLTFTRRLGSTYRTGWWFGPTWASTADQRLETDDQGVVFVTEDGRLLAYPHPAGTETDVLPEQGPRWPLARLETGGYTVTDPIAGHIRRFSRPDADGLALLEQISDRNGHTLTFAYDDEGTPLGIRHSGGYDLKVSTDADLGRITALSLVAAADDGTDMVIKRFGYDPDGNLIEDINSSGIPLTFTYDDRLRVTSWTDRNDERYEYTYDSRDRCIAEGGAAGHLALTLDYEGVDPAWPEAGVTTLTSAEGATTRFVVNDNCQIIAEIDALGHVTQTTYDHHHNLTAETDALGRTTRYAYNEAHQLTDVVRADGGELHAVYGGQALPVEFTDADGAVWRQGYDDRGNRTTVTDPAGYTTTYDYDEAGHLTAVTDPLGAVTRVECNAAGLPIRTTDPVGGAAVQRLDGFGRPVAVTDAVGATTFMEWTAEGLLGRRITPDGAQESWEYDAEGNCVSHTDAGGATTRYTYSHFDMLASRTDPDGAHYTFVHDRDLRLVQVTNPLEKTWDYTYDAAGRLVAESDFEGRRTRYELDAAGQLVSRTTPLGQRIVYGRTALGRLASKDTGDEVTTYAYDPVGRLVSAAGPSGELVYERDRLGRITAERWNGGVTASAYDPAGRRTRRTTPSGQVTTYGYDQAGRRSHLTVGGRRVDFARDAAGRETDRRIGQLALTSVRDPLGRPTRHEVKAGTTLVQAREYTYRPDGYPTSVDEYLGGRHDFDLDAGGRVTQVTAAAWSESYAYDSTGAQTAAAWPEGQDPDAIGDRAYTGTMVTHAGRCRYAYDGAGRLLRRTRTRLSKKPETWHFTYDSDDRLTAATTPDGARWRYEYDPLGHRRRKIRLAPGSDEVIEEVRFAYDGPTLIEQTTRAAQFPDPVTLTWDHDGVTPLTQVERITDSTTQREIDSRFFAIVTDLVGTPRELVAESGAIAWRTRTTLWGNVSWNREATAYTPLRFPGQYADLETGLHYNVNRYYDPATAHYTTPDPLGLAPAPNPTTYPHNPHVYADPLGLSPYGVMIDAGTARALSSADMSVGQRINAMIGNRDVFMSQTAMTEFQAAVSRGVSAGWVGPQEQNLAAALVNRVQVVADTPSARALGLNTTKKVGANDIQIFGTADELGMQIFTADLKFLVGAEAQGVVFDAIVHPSMNFIGR
ncbi:hypothetical protein DMB38_24100 [Streptomyces sp. WAC 06738]|uniref:DUF6531 domain-containing protein n=1 Tax=Streptomyces sp. WAC 06738 TaxID=2203210 RepID=UPI000F6D9F12|nr:DUF6531 domain-containing protein [Streptomyces sp. WAC 06738]AZM48454.1 hypothetical protein DMB38_24100 [Streptomyces sp. WAC 06738]